MALELDKITFAVDTVALEQAVTKVKELTAALAAMGKMPTITAGGIAPTTGNGDSPIAAGAKRTKKTVEDLQKTLEQTAKDIEAGFSKSEAAVLRNARAMKATDEQVNQLKESLIALRKNSDKPVIEPAVTKGVTNFGASVDKVTYTVEKQKIALDVLRGTTLQLSDGELALQRVYTNGQANRIAALKLQGASTEQMVKYTESVQDLNKILGVDPFDQSTSSLARMRKESSELTNVNALMREGLGLTRKQVIGLARDIEASRQSFASMGISTDSSAFKNAIANIKAQTVAEAQALNLKISQAKEADNVAAQIARREIEREEMYRTIRLGNQRERKIQMRQEWDAEIKAVEDRRKEWAKYYAEIEREEKRKEALQQRTAAIEQKKINNQIFRDQEDAANRVAKAQAFLAQETMRAEQALLGLNEQVNISTSNRLNRFERHLHMAGVEADFAEAELKKYKQTLLETDRLNAEKNKKARMDRLDYAARATSVQLGDIGISLAGGQNPLLVMIQQGDQLRAVLNDSALSADELRKVMSNASAQIVRGFVDVGRALSSFVVGGFKDAGRAVVDFASKISGLNYATNLLIETSPSTAESLMKIKKAVDVFMGGTIFLLVTTLVSVAVALKQVITEENALSKAMAFGGASMNMNKNAAYGFAESLRGVNDTIGSSVAALSAMAKEGGFATTQVKLVTKSANELKAVAGIAVEDTVKSFAKFNDEPTKALIELAKRTGLVSPEIIKLSFELERQGKKAEASALGMQELSNANSAAAKQIESEMGSLTKLGNSLGRIWDRVWDSIMGINRVDTLSTRINQARTQLTNMQLRQSGIPEYLRKQGVGDKEVQDAQNLLDSLLEQDRLLVKSNTQKQINIDLSEREAKWQERIKESEDSKVKFAIVEKQIRQDGIRLGKSELEIQTLINAERKKMIKPEARTAEEKFTDKSIRLFTRDAAEAEGKMNDLTKSQIDLLKVVSSPEWAKADHKKIASAFRDALEIDLENQKMEKQLVLYKQAVEAEKDYVDLLTKRHAENKAALITGMKQIDDAVEINNDLEFQMKLVGMTADEQKRLTAERKAYLELQKELADIEKKGEGVDKTTLRAYANTAYEQKLKNIGTQAGLDKLIEADKLQQSITDALVTGLTEGGKSGAAKLRNILQAELMKPITVFVRAIVSDISGMLGFSGNSAGGSLTSLASSFGGSIGSLASSAGAFFGSSSLSAFGAGAKGAYLAHGLAGPTTAGASGAMGAGSMAGTALGYAGGITTGVGIGRGISNGYGSNSAVNVGTAIGAFFGPLGAAIGGALGGVANRAFGRKLTEQGIQGSYSDGSFSGNSYEFLKGGWFRSDKTNTSALDPVMQKMLDSTYKGIDKTFNYIADKFETTVGNSFDAIKVNLMGLSESEAQAKLSEAIAASTKKTLDAIALPQWAADVVDSLGDKFSIESMNTALSGVAAMKDALDALGAASSAFAGITSDATTELIAEFGGIQTATQNLASYYQNFYPEEQRIEIATTALNKQLAKLGVAIPDSTSAYKKLVDDALIAGNEELAANLINLSGAFYEVKSAIESMTQSVIDEADRLRGEIVGSNSITTLGKNALLAEFGMLTELARGGDKSAMERLSEVSKQIEDLTKQQATSQAEVTKMQSYLSQSLYATAQSLGSVLPSYVSASTTTASTSDLSPLTATVQPAGNTASSAAATSQATNAARVEMLLTSLVDNISGLRDEIRADVSHNAKTAKILDRAMQDGQSLTVTVLA